MAQWRWRQGHPSYPGGETMLPAAPLRAGRGPFISHARLVRAPVDNHQRTDLTQMR